MPECYTDILIQELEAQGVSQYSVDDKGKHNKLRFVWHDRLLTHVYPKTPSDTRGALNSLSDLRRSMGVRRIIQKSSGEHQRKHRVDAAPERPLTITVKPDPFAVLASLKEVKCPTMTLAQVAAMLSLERRSAL